MRIEIVPQIELGNVSRLRVGDLLNKIIADPNYQQFRFAVAYMRMSGLDRLGASIDTLLNRGGQVSGAIGIDDEITSKEALETLSQISSNSTIFHTISGFIYHPKLYLVNGSNYAVAIIGSANLTRDGLYRNVELATAIYLDLNQSIDMEVYTNYDAFITELLNTSHPNVQLIDGSILQTLVKADVIKSEARTKEPGPPLRSKKKSSEPEAGLISIFPSISVPVAPPILKGIRPRPSPLPQIVRATPPTPIRTTRTFMMQLSSFDSSHRSGKRGTPEILIPNAAIDFFPPMKSSGRKYPDVYFDAILNTGVGYERHGYRFWQYDKRTENRLRLGHTTIDLSNPNGGDLIVINKLPAALDDDIFYEVTILPQSDPNFNIFLSQCTFIAQEKKWGIINT